MNNSTETTAMEVHYEVASVAADATAVAAAAVSEIAIRLERRLESQIDEVSASKAECFEMVVQATFQAAREASSYASEARKAARAIRIVDANIAVLSDRAKDLQAKAEWKLRIANDRIIDFDRISVSS